MMRKLTLTFDNGPDPECTPQVLDALAERGIKATFFVCAEGNEDRSAMPAAAPEGVEILERARDEGHWIGNHTLTHTLELGTTREPGDFEREIGRAQSLLGDFVEPRRLFRPYMGGGIWGPRCFSPEAVDYLCEQRYTTVLFNCLPRDWEIPETWPEVTFSQGEDVDWALLVLHDLNVTGAMRQLPRFLDECLSRGIEFAQDFPPECTPILDGRLVGSLDGLICES